MKVFLLSVLGQVNDLPKLSDYFAAKNQVHMRVQEAERLLHVFDVLAVSISIASSFLSSVLIFSNHSTVIPGLGRAGVFLYLESLNMHLFLLRSVA